MPRPQSPELVTYECPDCGTTTEQSSTLTEVMHTCRGPKGFSRPVWKAMVRKDD